MAAGKKPAIQANQGHPGGLADDFIKAISGTLRIRKQVKKAYPMIKGTDRKVVKGMRKEQLNKIKSAPPAPRPPTKKQMTPSMIAAQKQAKQKMYLEKLKGETKPKSRAPMTPTEYQKLKKKGK